MEPPSRLHCCMHDGDLAASVQLLEISLAYTSHGLHRHAAYEWNMGRCGQSGAGWCTEHKVETACIAQLQCIVREDREARVAEAQTRAPRAP